MMYVFPSVSALTISLAFAKVARALSVDKPSFVSTPVFETYRFTSCLACTGLLYTVEEITSNETNNNLIRFFIFALPIYS